jgi:hypothetical protein
MLPKLEAIKKLLLREWDPIGIVEMGGPDDEYDEYAFRIFAMLNEGSSAEAIASYLDWAEADQMMLRLDAERNRVVARRAIEIYSEQGEGPACRGR